MPPERIPSEPDAGRLPTVSAEFWEWFEGLTLRSLGRRDRALAARITEGTRARVERDATAHDAFGLDEHLMDLLRLDVEEQRVR